jgi:hypothetical protein
MADPALDPSQLPTPEGNPVPPPPPPSFGNGNSPLPEAPPPPAAPAPEPAPLGTLAGATPPEPAIPNYTVPEPPKFDPAPAISGSDPMVPNVTAGGAGLTTATIMPTSSGGTEAVNYSSGNGRGKIILLLVGGLMLILVLGVTAYIFFQNSTSQDAGVTTTEETTPVPTEAPLEEVGGDVLPTTPYENAEFAFTVDYPSDWTQVAGSNGTVVTFTDPATTLNQTKMTVRAEATTLDVTTYAQQGQKIFSQLYTNWTIVNNTNATIGTLPTIQTESTYAKGASNMGVMQLYAVKGGTAFTITIEAEETAFETLRPTTNQILSSLVFD